MDDCRLEFVTNVTLLDSNRTRWVSLELSLRYLARKGAYARAHVRANPVRADVNLEVYLLESLLPPVVRPLLLLRARVSQKKNEEGY